MFLGANVPEEREQFFLEVGKFIERHTKSSDLITSYPNLAFSVISANRLIATKQGNYIGNVSQDLEDFIRDIQDNGIDTLVVNSTNWPYDDSHPYFFSSNVILTRLQDDFKLLDTMGDIKLYKRVRK